MYRYLFAVAVVAMCALGMAGKKSGITGYGCKVEMETCNGRGRDPISKAEMEELERVVGEKLTFVVVDVDNTNGRQDFFFTTWCCNSVAAVKGPNDNKTWHNLREASAKADISDGAKALFDTCKVTPGGKGLFAFAFKNADVNSLTGVSAVQVWNPASVEVECK